MHDYGVTQIIKLFTSCSL